MNEKDIPLFDDNIRQVRHENEWWYVIEDVLATLIEASSIEKYMNMIMLRDDEFKNVYRPLRRILETNTRFGVTKLNCTNIEGIFRIIQSLDLPKVEPFKLWLAKLGKEKINKLNSPN